MNFWCHEGLRLTTFGVIFRFLNEQTFHTTWPDPSFAGHKFDFTATMLEALFPIFPKKVFPLKKAVSIFTFFFSGAFFFYFVVLSLQELKQPSFAILPQVGRRGSPHVRPFSFCEGNEQKAGRSDLFRQHFTSFYIILHHFIYIILNHFRFLSYFFEGILLSW